MSERATLTVTSVLGVLLFIVHWTQDVVVGIDTVGIQSYGGVALMVLWLSAATILRDRRAGKVTLLLFSILAAGMPVLLAAGMPVLHLKGSRILEIARGDGGLLYLLVLLTLAVTATFSAILAIRELRRR